MLDTCKGNDLTQADIRGGCLFVEVGGGLIAGVSAMGGVNAGVQAGAGAFVGGLW